MVYAGFKGDTSTAGVCVRACVRVCVCACVRVRACTCVGGDVGSRVQWGGIEWECEQVKMYVLCTVKSC